MEKWHQLWLSVIVQAARDLCFGNRVNKGASIAWLASEDFVEVCQLAGFQPGTVKKILGGMLKLNEAQQRSMIAKLEMVKGKPSRLRQEAKHGNT